MRVTVTLPPCVPEGEAQPSPDEPTAVAAILSVLTVPSELVDFGRHCLVPCHNLLHVPPTVGCFPEHIDYFFVADQILTVLSWLPETILLPSGEKATEHTHLVWPFNVSRCFPRETS